MLVGQKIGPFVVDKELGAGAMGAVYRARHEESGKRVAIKIVAPGLAGNETAMARFQREAAILKQLRHPNIVRLVATGRFSGTPFYAMEYVEGESLDRVMARRGRISWEEVVTLGMQLCEALEHAHDRGIVHRDLKPSNVMVLPDGTLKLTDFGIAKDLDVTALTSANCTVGTAAYMSPEQCRGERDISHKSDLYSLGIMFYELLTGRKPFHAENPMDMFMQHVQGTFERPSRSVLDIPVWLDNLVCQLMEKKPDQRPLNAATVAEALGRIKEKVEAQQSAGIDAARGRAIDRPKDRPRLDEDDREAARSLLGKKKKKKKAAPLTERTWFKAALYGSGLVVLLVVFYLLVLKKPSADSLHEQARKVFDTGTLEEKAEARKEGPIAAYLRYYGERDDAQAKEVRSWADRIDGEYADDLLLRRLRKGLEAADSDEKRAWLAIEEEDAGKLADARILWGKLLKNKEEKEAEKRAYGLAAEERLRKLDEVDAREKKVVARIQKGEILKEAPKSEEPEELALYALGRELTGSEGAAAAWEKLHNALKLDLDDPAKRPWYLMATRHWRELKGPPAPKEKSPH
jgi:serine/threonine-protein kinase